MEATLTADYEIIEYAQLNGQHKVKLKLLNNTTTNELLTSLIKFGDIHSFNELIPNMNEIFIKVVAEENKRIVNNK